MGVVYLVLAHFFGRLSGAFRGYSCGARITVDYHDIRDFCSNIIRFNSLIVICPLSPLSNALPLRVLYGTSSG